MSLALVLSACAPGAGGAGERPRWLRSSARPGAPGDAGCDVTYLCTDTCHARVTQFTPAVWGTEFQDSGCGCGGRPCGLHENLSAIVAIT